MTRHASWRQRVWTAWIRVLLLAFPGHFRRRLGADLAAQYGSRPPDSARQWLRRAMAALAELVPAGLGARRDDLRLGRRSRGGGLLRDLAIGGRMLRRRPLYGASVVLTLALAGGFATAVFGVVDVVLLRPLPFPDDDRLVSIGSDWTNVEHAAVSIPEYLDYGAQAPSLASVAVYRSTSANLASDAGPERLQAAAVSASFFDVLGTSPAHGRVFTPMEDRPGGERVVVLSYRVWLRQFGGAPDAIGQTMRIDDEPMTIVGVMPASFRYPANDTDLWLPLRVNTADPGGRGAHTRRAIARLAAGVSFAAARDELIAIGERFAREYPQDYPPGSGWRVSVKPLREHLAGDLRTPLQLLFAAVLFVLAIAAANTAALMLAQASDRHAEFAARAALGASRLRLVRQLTAEGTTVGAAGGALGLAAASVLLQVVPIDLPAAVVPPDLLMLDVRAAVFAFGSTMLAATLAAASVALLTTPREAAAVLRSGGRATGSLAMRRFRSALVAGELALAFVLLTGTGLALRSLAQLLDVDSGFVAAGVSTARLSLPSARYPTGRDTVAFHERLLASLDTTPGVRHAGAISILPLTGSDADANFGVEGFGPPTPGTVPNAQVRFVAGEYFRAIGIPLTRGRLFDDRDHADAPFVAIASEALARQYWAGRDAVGRRFKMWRLSDDGPWRTVVGVVGDVRHHGLGEAAPPILYLPVAQFPQRTLTVLVRSESGGPQPQVIERAVRNLDPEQPVFDSRSMDAWVASSTAQPRFGLVLSSAFAVTALVLAAVGIYGIVAFTVTRRARELGIRVALGAEPRRLMRGVLRRALLLTAAGLGAGLAGALYATRQLAAVLYGVQPLDPLVYAAAVVTLGTVALLASAVPARRVLTLDPVAAIRHD